MSTATGCSYGLPSKLDRGWMSPAWSGLDSGGFAFPQNEHSRAGHLSEEMVASHIATNRWTKDEMRNYSSAKGNLLSPMSCLTVFNIKTKYICLHLIPLQLRTCAGSSVFCLTWFYFRLHRSVLSKVKSLPKGASHRGELKWGSGSPCVSTVDMWPWPCPFTFNIREFSFVNWAGWVQ